MSTLYSFTNPTADSTIFYFGDSPIEAARSAAFDDEVTDNMQWYLDITPLDEGLGGKPIGDIIAIDLDI